MRISRIITGAFSALALLVGMGVTAPAANAEINVYTTPGEHTINGRQWRTWCEPYSRTARCTTQIKVAGVWTFNNLTYLPSPRTLWKGNPLATPGYHTVAGRKWFTECDTARTGRNGCRSYIDSTGRGNYVFNNLVQFGAIRSDLKSLYRYRPPADPKPTPPPSGSYSITRGPNTSNRAILTFDDCPKSLSSFKTTVKAFADMGISVALFPTGDCITAGRFDASYARSLGHYVFNHSVSHPQLTDLSKSAVIRQLGSPGVVTTYGRPPYGAYNSTVREAYAAVGMRIWTWTVDTNDWRGKSSSQLVSYVVNNVKGGDTVLMHMQWNGFNASAVRQMKDGLADKGVGLCRNNGATAVKPAGVTC